MRTSGCLAGKSGRLLGRESFSPHLTAELFGRAECVGIERIRLQLAIDENLAIPGQNDRTLGRDRMKIWSVFPVRIETAVPNL